MCILDKLTSSSRLKQDIRTAESQRTRLWLISGQLNIQYSLPNNKIIFLQVHIFIIGPVTILRSVSVRDESGSQIFLNIMPMTLLTTAPIFPNFNDSVNVQG